MAGWVYIITNRAMPGLLKVGFTTRHPEARAQELTSTGKTGVPWEYVVEDRWEVEDPRALEQRVHKKLGHVRENREWFRCTVEGARAVVEKEIPPRQRTRSKPAPAQSEALPAQSEAFNIAERIDAVDRKLAAQRATFLSIALGQNENTAQEDSLNRAKVIIEYLAVFHPDRLRKLVSVALPVGDESADERKQKRFLRELDRRYHIRQRKQSW